MPKEMTLEEAAEWMFFLENSGKYGFTNENRKIMSQAKKVIKAAFTKHRSPSGRPWAPTERRPDPEVIYIGYEQQKALYRGGKKGVKRLRAKMSGPRNTPGHIERAYKFGFEVGGYGRGLVKHNRGEGKMPKRTFAEWTPDLIDFAAQTYADGVIKRIEKGSF